MNFLTFNNEEYNEGTQNFNIHYEVSYIFHECFNLMLVFRGLRNYLI